MKLADELKAIEQFVLDHKPPPEIRAQIHILQEHLDADDSLLDRIAANDARLAKTVADHSAQLATLKAQQAEAIDRLKAQQAKVVKKLEAEILGYAHGTVHRLR